MRIHSNHRCLKVLGHECGHGAFSKSPLLNNGAGFILHSSLLTPYFSWRSTHRTHHRYSAHIEKDSNYVPLCRDEYLQIFSDSPYELIEDAPLYVLGRLILQQTLGWPLYLIYGTTSARSDQKRRGVLPYSHFNPYGAFFFPREAGAVLLSDLGVLMALCALFLSGQVLGLQAIALLYGMPFLWLNQWIVAITYLQHTHPDVHRYEARDWTFFKGALATMDRDLGFVGRFFFHYVAETHVIHHLFP